MSSRLRPGLLVAAVACLVVALATVLVRSRSDPSVDALDRATTTSAIQAPATAPSTTTTAPTIVWPLVADDQPRVVVTPNGVVLPVLRPTADGRFEARSPCGATVVVSGTALSSVSVVIDPGHGGDEPGAVGPGGTREKDVNLAIALETERRLEAQGATVVLTRTSDYRITLASRTAIAKALRPALFLSIHHNAEPDELRPTPGVETYRQIASPESKRASGLIYEELLAAFSRYEIEWGADRDAGAKYRPRADGGDYYGILSGSAGVPAVLSEAAFISNPPEEALLVDPTFQAVEAEALTRAIIRYVTTSDPGSGFIEPYPRTAPAGSGGGARGCVDPALG